MLAIMIHGKPRKKRNATQRNARRHGWDSRLSPKSRQQGVGGGRKSKWGAVF